MGRYDSIVRLAEIRRLMHEKKYRKAFQIIEKIDSDKVKAITDLNLLVEVCMKNEEYQMARNLLLKIYEKTSTRRIIYQLICVSLKTGNLDHVEELYEEYKELDKNSSDRLILRYCIDKAKRVEKERLVQYLEQLKKEDYQEEWAYELAKLYHKMGMEDACVRECSDIILWFGEGLIVEKAKLLKLHYVEGLDIVAHSESAHAEIEPSEIEHDHKTDEEIDQMENNNEEIDQMENSDEEVDQIENHDGEVGQDSTEEVQAEQGYEEQLEETVLNSVDLEKESMQHEEHGMASQGQETNHEADPNQSLATLEVEQNSIERLIKDALNNISENESSMHFILVEENNSGLTQVVKEFAKQLFYKGILPSSQIAKITGEKLNGISLENNYEKLKNGCLLIEQAGDLTSDAVDQVLHLMEANEDAMVVILEDNEEAIKWLLKKNKKLKSVFPHIIFLPTNEKDGLM